MITPALLCIVIPTSFLCCRAAARACAHGRPWFERSIALVGDAANVEFLDQRIRRHPEWGLKVDLEVMLLEGDGGWQVRRPPVNGGSVRVTSIEPVEGPGVMAVGIAGLVTDARIDRAMVAGGMEHLSSRTELVHTMLDSGVAVDLVNGGPETLYATAMPQHLEGMSIISSRPSYPRPMGRAIKRSMDVAISSALLVVTSPILLFAAIRIKLDSNGPVFFRQERSGLDGQIFEIIKLRTMVEGAHEQRSQLRLDTESLGNDDVLFKLDEDPRVTKVGEWLRRTSLDELPQLFNVVKGDMSMVGPRPLVPEEAEQAYGLFKARTRMKPGVAGPWQAEGRSGIPFDDMLKLDYSYVASWSLGEDINLLLRTFTAVITGSGAK